MCKNPNPSERLLRKRRAARLRQQRCRERKRLALLKEAEKRQKNKKRDTSTSTFKNSFQLRVSVPQEQFGFNHYSNISKIVRPQNPMSATLESYASSSHLHLGQQYPIKIPPYRPPSPEETAVDAMLSLKGASSPCETTSNMIHRPRAVTPPSYHIGFLPV